ncbi:MAG: beta-aspartyl-peptidase [Clostridiales bacterium]|nr:beta-aspartyl-peptidase [Clostridiales bacterium]
MITIIKNIEVYSPCYLGVKDIVIVGDKFEGIYDKVNIPNNFININVIEGKDKIIFPGFIDSHVHIIGGGGEDSFKSRTPEIKLTNLTKAGITTVIGCIGTDGICRDMSELLAKVYSLEEEGISAFCYTGSYDVPVRTVTSNIKKDIMLINKIIGVGEIAISDRRSSQPSFEEITHIVAEANVGGLLSGKAGIVHFHVGPGKRKIDMLFKLIEETEILPSQIIPTHINRSEELFEEGLRYVSLGGYIDLTTSSDPNYLEPTELTASEGLKRYVDSNLPIEKITFSSDGNGSMPKYNNKREIVGLSICSVKSLYIEVKKAIINYNIPIDTAIKVITSNVADLYRLQGKGWIKEGYSSDFVIVDKDSLDIDSVYAKGMKLVNKNEAIVKGIFE